MRKILIIFSIFITLVLFLTSCTNINKTGSAIEGDSYCGDGICNFNEKYYNCPGDCAALTCTDSDEYSDSANWTIKGEITGTLSGVEYIKFEYEDSCVDDNDNPVTESSKLKEFTCLYSQFSEDPKYSIGIDIIPCLSGCENGACKLPTCIDSDGYNIYEKGSCIDIMIKERYPGGTFMYDDRCTYSNSLKKVVVKEYSCSLNGDNIEVCYVKSLESGMCKYGDCSNGVCPKPSSCSEVTDGQECINAECAYCHSAVSIDCINEGDCNQYKTEEECNAQPEWDKGQPACSWGSYGTNCAQSVCSNKLW